LVVEERPQNATSGQGSPDDPSHDIYTIANIITVLRLILVPFFFAVLINGENDILAFALFAVAASTDWLDGQIARRTGTVTALGKAFDPLVDRLLIASGVLGLYMIDRLPGWIVIVLFARDVYLMYGAWRLEQFHHRRMPVSFAGKVTTAVLLIGFADMILNWPVVPGLGLVESVYLPGLGIEPVVLGMYFVYVGVALSLATAVHYTFLFSKIVSEGATS
jgi:cardiolipin synthase (CMP-forming)